MAGKSKQQNKQAPQKQTPVAPPPPAPPRGLMDYLLNFRIQCIVLIILGLVFYANTFNNESAFDDRMVITDNEYVQQGFAGIPGILTHDAYQSYVEHRNSSNQLSGGRYRPLSLITFAIEQQFMGTDNGQETPDMKQARIAQEMHPRHVVNVMLYILSAMVLLYFLSTTVFAAQPLAAFIAAVLFLIHPIHTEVVANVKGRDEILSALFILLTFIYGLKYYDNKKTKTLLFALSSFFLALLAKEYAVTLIVLLPLCFYLFRQAALGKSAQSVLPYFVPLGLYLLLRFSSVISAAEGAENNIMNNPYLFATGTQKIASEIWVLLDYLKLLFVPYPLVSDYSYNQVPYTSFANPAVWLSVAIYGAMIILMFRLFSKRHVLCFAIAIYLANLALVSNFFFNIGAPLGERLIYHSSIGFCIALAWLLYKGYEWIKQPAVALGGLVAIMALLIVLSAADTIARNRDWKNDNTLSLADIATSPNSVLIINNAAAASMMQAKLTTDSAGRKEWFTKAINYFSRAIALNPMYLSAYLNRGLCNFNMGMPDKALTDWDTVRKYDPSLPNLSKYLSVAGKYFFTQGMRYEQSGQPDMAIAAFNKSIEAVPTMADPWLHIAGIYSRTGRLNDAENTLEKAMQAVPGNADIKRMYEQVRAIPVIK